MFEIFGETDEFAEFEELFEKCLRADRKRRPRDAIELRSESVLVDFLEKLENGARPCDLVQPPFEDKIDTRIRELKEIMAKKDKNVAELEKRLEAQIREKDEIIEKNKEVSKVLSSLFHLKNYFSCLLILLITGHCDAQI